ncbi:predicted protein [Naegleria gruberi]|uniref:DNA polymerase epsilon catalytic subunit n=1 Tax=Naegleria gruberi TaxID=5762 RepID=D2VT72_NAEGR|nr:uncharacterized protein NAEGRDRAFT_59151 [Naegleria gruberi]EFC40096.1 predicted protein [Naegleria gruberi]|eukprot:XP_002672840.1 predicted protein [Naegleria gruberi strain NEG-M]
MYTNKSNNKPRLLNKPTKKKGDHGSQQERLDDDEKAQQLKEYREKKKLEEIEIDKRFFGPQMEGTKNLGWLVNFRATSVPEKLTMGGSGGEDDANSSDMDLAAVVLYFMSDEGDSFSVTKVFEPYFYIAVKDDNSFTEVCNYLTSMDPIVSLDIVDKEDLDKVNHLSGIKAKYLKLRFKNVQQLMEMRSKLLPIIEKNKKKSQDSFELLEEELLNEEMEDQFLDDLDDYERGIRRKRKAKLSTIDCVDKIVDIREYDIKYHIRCAIDTDLRVGYWYDISVEEGNVLISKREDIEERAVPKVCAFDIETTKPPLMFPDPQSDRIMMISYMIDGHGYLIVNREIVAEDIENFDYTPKDEFPGYFEVFNVENEKELLLKWFSHMQEEKPCVYVTYNGDFFDWPFIEQRASVYSLNLRDHVGYYRMSGDCKKLGSDTLYGSSFGLHIDCLYWVIRDSYLPQGSHGLKAVTKAKLKYDPIEVDPEDMLPFATSQPQKLASYSVSDAVSTYYLYMKYINPFIFSLCNIIPMPPDEVLRKGSGTLCETLLMVQAFKGNIIFPNRYQSDPEKMYKGHLLASETYIGGRVEGLKSGVYRSDIPYKFKLNPDRYQQLVDNVDRVIRFAIEVEQQLKVEDVANFEELKQEIIDGLLKLKEKPEREECPKLYHLDVGAMYPNIILTHRLQPSAIVNEDTCAQCIYNKPENDCKRIMKWHFRAEYFTASRSEFNIAKNSLMNDNPNFTNEELRKRVGEISQKAHKKKYNKESMVKDATICQRENPFYVNTVREFRDRRYVLKDKSKEWKDKSKDPEFEEKSKVMLVLYDSLQLAHKCILNSFYGYVMRKAARWYSMEMAGVVTYNGAQIIRMARELIDDIGISLELDTDGIWCMLPGSFPENYTLKLTNGKKRTISYPCLMLNADVAQNFSNDQYQNFNPETGKWDKRAECSIFFEVDGPYRAMILPASKEEGKSIKKRYAVFNHDGTLAELKGFEIKRRGELKLIKIFQSQVFEQFLKGYSLSECYQHVAEIANRWLDILYTKGEGIETKQLFDYITESSNMSKRLEEYGNQKAARITAAKRLVDLFGEQMVRDKGLVCSYIVAKKPENASVTERVIPTVVFQKEESVCLSFLKKWTKDTSMTEIDLKEIVDWDYYIERLGSAIQKIITIPAALQAIDNPVPRVKHPDWLLKKLRENASQSKQRSLMDMLKKIPVTEDSSSDSDEEMEDASGDEKPKSKSTKRKIDDVDDDSLGEEVGQKRKKKKKKNKTKKSKSSDGNTLVNDGTMASYVQFYSNQLKDLVWHVIEVRESETPGLLKLFISVGGKMRTFKIEVPRVVYLNFYQKQGESEEPHKKLPILSSQLVETSVANKRDTFLYRKELLESYYQKNLQTIYSEFSNPHIQGVYETQIDPVLRAVLSIGSLCQVHPKSREKIDSANTLTVSDLVQVDGSHSKKNPGVSYLKDVTNLQKLYLFESCCDVRGVIGLFSFANKKAYIYLIHSIDLQTTGLHPDRLFDEVLDQIIEQSNLNITEIEEFELDVFKNRVDVLKEINNILAKERKASSLLLVQSPFSYQTHSASEIAPMLEEIPIVAIPFSEEDNKYQHALSAYWTNNCIKQMFIRYCAIEKWYKDMTNYSNYCGIPIGNIESNDFVMHLIDMMFGRSLQNDYVLWLSKANKPDLGGCENDALQQQALLSDDQLYSRSGTFINHSACYHSVCVEFDISHLDINAILQSSFIEETIDDKISNSSKFSTVTEIFKIFKQVVSKMFADVHNDDNTCPDVPDLLLSNLYRWCCNTHAKLFHPEILAFIYRLQKKVFLQLCAHFKKCGCRIIYANFTKIIVDTGKNTTDEAKVYTDYLKSSIQQQKLFTWVDIEVKNTWSNLLWFNQDNFLGFKEDQETETGLSSDPHIDLLSELPESVRVHLVFYLSTYMYECLKYRRSLDEKISTMKAEEVQKIQEEHAQEYLTTKFSEGLMEVMSNQLKELSLQLESEKDIRLEFVNAICHMLSIDLFIRDEVNVLKRSLLKLLGVKEFSSESMFKRSQNIFKVPDMICSFCSSCCDLELGKPTTENIFKCKHCSNDFDKSLIEGRLIDYVQNKMVGYQLQDLQCSRCSQINANNVLERCHCSGKWISAQVENKSEKVADTIHLIHSISQQHNFDTLNEIISYMLKKKK